MIIGSPEWLEAISKQRPPKPRPDAFWVEGVGWCGDEIPLGKPEPCTLGQKSPTDLWANFLSNEKMTPAAVGKENVMILVDFCKRLGEIRGPKIKEHKLKLESRRFVCQKAMEWGIDLPSMCKIGRGLLDAWLLVYKETYGGVYGTAAFREATRRNVVTKLTKERDKEKEVPDRVLREMNRFLNPETRHDESAS